MTDSLPSGSSISDLSDYGAVTVPGIQIHTEAERAEAWLKRFRGCPWSLVCTLGFTETALVPGISAAGQTPEDRRWTAIADSEFLCNGLVPQSPSAQASSAQANSAQANSAQADSAQAGYSQHPLPPLTAGLSPVLITRALLEYGQIPLQVFNAGLPQTTATTGIDLGGQVSACVSSGHALPLTVAQHLFQSGLNWGQRLAQTASSSYFVLGECVVGGTTTALGLLTGLGISAQGRVNSSHPQCNHQQKQALVNQGIAAFRQHSPNGDIDPLAIAAALGDPMQPFVAGLAIAASQTHGVLLAGGTQMLAVYALAAAIIAAQSTQADWTAAQALAWNPNNIAVGTTRWVALDPSGDTPGLAQAIGQQLQPSPILLASALSFEHSAHPGLRAYEAGFVKEGVAAGGSAIATSLCYGLGPAELLTLMDEFCDRYDRWKQA